MDKQHTHFHNSHCVLSQFIFAFYVLFDDIDHGQMTNENLRLSKL